MVKIKECTNGGYKEHRNPSLPARLGEALLDKCPSCWYSFPRGLSDINLSVGGKDEKRGV